MTRQEDSGQAETYADTDEQFVSCRQDMYGRIECREKTVSLVVFRLAQEWYGIDILKSKEIIKIEQITFLPSSPAYIAGIINLRGSIVSVTDLRKIFSLPSLEPSEQARLLIIHAGPLETAVLTDEVDSIFEVPLAKLEPPLATIPMDKAQFLEGQCKMDERLVGVLNVDKIFAQTVHSPESVGV